MSNNSPSYFDLANAFCRSDDLSTNSPTTKISEKNSKNITWNNFSLVENSTKNPHLYDFSGFLASSIENQVPLQAHETKQKNTTAISTSINSNNQKLSDAFNSRTQTINITYEQVPISLRLTHYPHE